MRELWMQRLCLERLSLGAPQSQDPMSKIGKYELLEYFMSEDTNTGVYGVERPGLERARGISFWAFRGLLGTI